MYVATVNDETELGRANERNFNSYLAAAEDYLVTPWKDSSRDSSSVINCVCNG